MFEQWVNQVRTGGPKKVEVHLPADVEGSVRTKHDLQQIKRNAICSGQNTFKGGIRRKTAYLGFPYGWTESFASWDGGNSGISHLTTDAGVSYPHKNWFLFKPTPKRVPSQKGPCAPPKLVTTPVSCPLKPRKRGYPQRKTHPIIAVDGRNPAPPFGNPGFRSETRVSDCCPANTKKLWFRAKWISQPFTVVVTT